MTALNTRLDTYAQLADLVHEGAVVALAPRQGGGLVWFAVLPTDTTRRYQPMSAESVVQCIGVVSVLRRHAAEAGITPA